MELEKEIRDNVDLNKGDRFYVIYKRKNDDGIYNSVGRFIIGNRKASPWEGYAPSDDDTLDM